MFRLLPEVCLNDLVPQDNFYFQVEECLDLDFVRDPVCGLYSDTGRPSINPVVFFQWRLIVFFEGIRSELQLMKIVNLRLDHRWYIGYDLGESVPDHSSLSKIRERYRLEIFQRFFERVVELCIEAGLVWGEEFYLDATKARANAQICNSCPVKRECTESKSGRHMFRSFFQEHVDRVKAYHDTEEYQQAMRKRGVWVKPYLARPGNFTG